MSKKGQLTRNKQAFEESLKEKSEGRSRRGWSRNRRRSRRRTKCCICKGREGRKGQLPVEAPFHILTLNLHSFLPLHLSYGAGAGAGELEEEK